jgi:hypothetical protein
MILGVGAGARKLRVGEIKIAIDSMRLAAN